MSNDAKVQGSVVPLLLRLALGVIFLYHGWDKVAGRDNEWGTLWAANASMKKMRPPTIAVQALEREQARLADQAAKAADDGERDEIEAQQESLQVAIERVRHAYVERSQLPEGMANSAIQLAVAWGEVVGGLALLLGLLTRVAALGMIIIQVGAILLVTGARGFVGVMDVGYEYNIALIAMCLALVLLGGGALSLDRVLRREKQAQAASAPHVPAHV
jgi:uncharacterized membrane protein YphA (DoxX/SURF4 family)